MTAAPSRAQSTIEPVSDLVYDVGLHRGEDTAFYLRKGFRVVAFEASPAHVEHARRRFAHELDDGRLVLVAGAIGEGDAPVPFFVHPVNSEWGTTDATWAERNERLGQASHAVTVPVVDFASALAEHGTPHYLKIDIEGADHLCIRTLEQTGRRPTYISLEATKASIAAARAEIAMLERLGYDAFALRQQARTGGRSITTTTYDGRSLRVRAEPSASGDFGAELAGWSSARAVLRRVRAVHLGYRLLGDDGIARRVTPGRWIADKLTRPGIYAFPGWHDLHARHVDA